LRTGTGCLSSNKRRRHHSVETPSSIALSRGIIMHGVVHRSTKPGSQSFFFLEEAVYECCRSLQGQNTPVSTGSRGPCAAVARMAEQALPTRICDLRSFSRGGVVFE